MLDPSNLARSWQKLVQMATPACRVIALAIATDGRPVQNRFNASSQAACRLRLRGPDRFDTSHDECRVDLINGQMAYDRPSEVLEGAAPLLNVLRVTPAWGLGLDVKLCTLSEGQHVLVGRACRDLPGPFVSQWVDALVYLLALACGQIASFRQCYIGIGTKPQPGIFAVLDKQSGDSLRHTQLLALEI